MLWHHLGSLDWLRRRNRRWRRQGHVDQTAYQFSRSRSCVNLEASEEDKADPQLHKQDPRQRHEALAGVRPTEALRRGGHPSAPLQLSIIAAAWSRCRTVDRAPGYSASDSAYGRSKQPMSYDCRSSNCAGDAAGNQTRRSRRIAAIFVTRVIGAAIVMMMPVVPHGGVGRRRDCRHGCPHERQRGQDFRNGTHCL